MNELVLAGLLGGVGGLTRGVVGLLKCRKSQKLISNTYDFRACSKTRSVF